MQVYGITNEQIYQILAAIYQEYWSSECCSYRDKYHTSRV